MTSAELLQQQLNATTRRRKPKGVKPDKQAAQEYQVALRRIVREVRKDVDEYIMGAVKSTSYEYVADSWVDTIAGALDFVKGKWNTPQFKAVATRIARKFVTTADRNNEQRTKRDLGIDIFIGNQEMVDYVEASIYDNVRLIESIPQQYLTQVDSIVMSNVRAGGRPSAIAKLLEQQFGVTERRAKLIARDQTAKINGDLTRMRQSAAGFDYFRWNTSHDERVRDRHAHIGERVTAYGKGIYKWSNPPLGARGTPVIPGTEFQCFPGTSQLDNTTFCNILYRRFYTGELTELVFNDGTVLSSTANHPILTNKGFKAAHLINKSDNIVRTLDESVLSVELNRKGVKPTFEQIFSTLNLLGVEVGVSTSTSGEFHGDISDGDINVIELNSLLMHEINPSINELLREFNFTGTDKVIIFNSFTCFGDGDFSVDTFRDTFSCFMSRRGLDFSLFLSHLTPLQRFGFALGSWFDAKPVQLSPNDVSGEFKMFSDCVFAFSTLIHGHHLFTEIVDSFLLNKRGGFNSSLFNRSTDNAGRGTREFSSVLYADSTTYKLDNIVDSRTVCFSGHVYNLQTISGDYNTGATMVSNCRCVAEPVSNEEVKENQRKGLTNPNVKR